MTDPSPEVRKQAVDLIKARKDEWAMGAMVKSYIDAYDDGDGIRDPIKKVAAEAALRSLDMKRVYGHMFYYATLEIRTVSTTLNSFVTRQIDSFQVLPNAGVVNNGVAGAAIIPLSFPIQFPELGITRAFTTVKAPCQAMSELSGMDFGNDLDKWAKWMRIQK